MRFPTAHAGKQKPGLSFGASAQLSGHRDIVSNPSPSRKQGFTSTHSQTDPHLPHFIPDNHIHLPPPCPSSCNQWPNASKADAFDNTNTEENLGKVLVFAKTVIRKKRTPVDYKHQIEQLNFVNAVSSGSRPLRCLYLSGQDQLP